MPVYFFNLVILFILCLIIIFMILWKRLMVHKIVTQQYLQSLESKVKEISSLNESLRVQNESLKRRVGELEAEVCVHSVLWVVTLQASSPYCEK